MEIGMVRRLRRGAWRCINVRTSPCDINISLDPYNWWVGITRFRRDCAMYLGPLRVHIRRR